MGFLLFDPGGGIAGLCFGFGDFRIGLVEGEFCAFVSVLRDRLRALQPFGAVEVHLRLVPHGPGQIEVDPGDVEFRLGDLDVLLLALDVVLEVDPVHLEQQIALLHPVAFSDRNQIEIAAGPAGDFRGLLGFHVGLHPDFLDEFHLFRLHGNHFDRRSVFSRSADVIPVAPGRQKRGAAGRRGEKHARKTVHHISS